jgi:hypothetical protein
VRVREAKNRQPGGRQDLVANTVTSLLRGCAVVAQTVGLDDEPQLLPVEVHAKAMEPVLGERLRQARPVRDWHEPPLELRVSEEKGRPTEDAAEPG